jgi:3-oxoacyl-[acyl-carrier protein] reductase
LTTNLLDYANLFVLGGSNMDLQLKDKVIMVAAGSKGLGFGIAQACAREGAIVSVASPNQSNVDAAIERLKEAGGEAHGAIIDARNKASIEAWAASVFSTFPTGRYGTIEEFGSAGG